MTPFAAPNEKEVMASIAVAVNNLEENNAIAKAPHHFEIWHLGQVLEDGTIVAEKYLVADCNTLIRPSGDRQAMAGSPIKTLPGTPEQTSVNRGTNTATPPN